MNSSRIANLFINGVRVHVYFFLHLNPISVRVNKFWFLRKKFLFNRRFRVDKNKTSLRILGSMYKAG